MKQINEITEKDEQLIAKYTLFIRELAHVQDSYLQQLTTDLDLDEQGGEFLFDYVFNFSNEECPTFTDYMARFPNHESENAK